MVQLVTHDTCLDHARTRVRHTGSMGCHTKHMESQHTSHPVHMQGELVTNNPYFDISHAYRRTFMKELNALVSKYIRGALHARRARVGKQSFGVASMSTTSFLC